MSKIANCPSCGKKAKVYTSEILAPPAREIFEGFFVQCSDLANCEKCPRTDCYEVEEEAVQAWNEGNIWNQF